MSLLTFVHSAFCILLLNACMLLVFCSFGLFHILHHYALWLMCVNSRSEQEVHRPATFFWTRSSELEFALACVCVCVCVCLFLVFWSEAESNVNWARHDCDALLSRHFHPSQGGTESESVMLEGQWMRQERPSAADGAETELFPKIEIWRG